MYVFLCFHSSCALILSLSDLSSIVDTRSFLYNDSILVPVPTKHVIFSALSPTCWSVFTLYVAIPYSSVSYVAIDIRTDLTSFILSDHMMNLLQRKFCIAKRALLVLSRLSYIVLIMFIDSVNGKPR